jgi:hypothetical protein
VTRKVSPIARRVMAILRQAPRLAFSALATAPGVKYPETFTVELPLPYSHYVQVISLTQGL